MKKIDDQVMLEMVGQGRLQTEISEHFGVSPAAVCKRLKRLRSIQEPPSFKDLSQKEKKFALEVADGKTQTDAALASHDVTTRDSAKALGHELMAKNDIKRAIEEVLQEQGLTKAYRIRKLKEHVDSAIPDISLRGLDQTHKLAGDYQGDKHLHLHVADYNSLERNLKEIEAEIAKEQAKLGTDVINGEAKVVEQEDSKVGP